MLEKLLQEMVNKALESEGAIEKGLKHGLYIHLKKYPDEPKFMLTIFREGVDPSAQEWNTVIAHWPYELGPMNWSKKGMTTDGRHFMQAQIKSGG